MSLPAALQARLAKRGIIKEEIIAESYDETSLFLDPSEQVNCPNRANPYHKCVKHCKERYGLKVFTPSTIIEKRRLKMLKLYPLPPKWKEIPDLSTNRYYYWNIETDQVSWLSPTHPNAFITESIVASPIIKPSKEVIISKTNDDIDELLDTIQNETLQNRKQKRVALDPMDPSSYSDIPQGTWSSGLETSKDT